MTAQGLLAALPGDPVPIGLLANASPEQEVAGAEHVSLAIENRRHPPLQGLEVGGIGLEQGLRRPVGLANSDLDRGRVRGDRHDVLDAGQSH